MGPRAGAGPAGDPPRPGGGRPHAVPAWWVRQVACAALVAQRHNHLILPDEVLAAMWWGAGPRPANWRRRAVAALFRHPSVAPVDTAVPDDFDPEAEPRPRSTDPGWRRGVAACPLHGRHDARHRHFHCVLLLAEMGVMAAFARGPASGGTTAFDFRNPRLTRDQAAPGWPLSRTSWPASRRRSPSSSRPWGRSWAPACAT